MSDELERNHPASDEGKDENDIEGHRLMTDDTEESEDSSDDVEAHRQHGGVGRQHGGA